MEQEQFQLPPPSEEIESKVENMKRSAAYRPAAPQYVRFYSRSKRDKEASAREKRPIFMPVEYVEILVPGDKDSVADRPVREIDRYCWPDLYTRFRRNQSQETPGMPLTEWGGVTPERAHELAFFRVKTVEQLADVSDGVLQGLGLGARAEREKAKAYLLVMKGDALGVEMRAENDLLKTRIAALEKLAASGAAQEEVKAVKPTKKQATQSE
jgi:hypothetical protein